jgi:hypothetical protein
MREGKRERINEWQEAISSKVGKGWRRDELDYFEPVWMNYGINVEYIKMKSINMRMLWLTREIELYEDQ